MAVKANHEALIFALALIGVIFPIITESVYNDQIKYKNRP
jgi:hypothetical protein